MRVSFNDNFLLLLFFFYFQAVFPLVTTFLEIFLLIGLSSHLSKILVVYTEIIQFPHGRHMKETVICIITGKWEYGGGCDVIDEYL